jgi:hypothetical protein
MKVKAQTEPVEHSTDSAKGEVYIMVAYIKNTERSQINDIILHLELLNKQE